MYRDPRLMTKTQLAWRAYAGRGANWRAAFRYAKAKGESTYNAALIAEAALGPDEFLGVCKLALKDA